MTMLDMISIHKYNSETCKFSLDIHKSCIKVQQISTNKTSFYCVLILETAILYNRKIEETENKETRPNTKQKAIKVFMFL